MRRQHIINTFSKKAEKKWDTLYWAVDIHDTCIKANYKAGDIPTEFFPNAKEALTKIGNREDCCLILFTCSHPHEIEKYLDYFKSHGIKFKHVNKNPEAENTAFGFFEHKFYTNFILDDKAGFDPKQDWPMIINALEEVEYIESTTEEERKKHKRIESLFPVIFSILAMLSIWIGIALAVNSHWILGTLVAAVMFTALTFFLINMSQKAPYKFHANERK